jgi:hypothetical protein
MQVGCANSRHVCPHSHSRGGKTTVLTVRVAKKYLFAMELIASAADVESVQRAAMRGPAPSKRRSGSAIAFWNRIMLRRRGTNRSGFPRRSFRAYIASEDPLLKTQRCSR